jgi:dipeptidyl aminopeptidase/acylaminoacyl peptidase
MKYKRIIPIISFICLLAITNMTNLPAQDNSSGKSILTPETLMGFQRISEPKLSPEGKWILYNIGTPNIPDNKIYKDLYLISIDGKDNKRLTNTPYSKYNSIWSPDGSQIAFISMKTGTPQINVCNSDGSDLHQVTDIPEGVSNISWSPDGKYFSFTSEVQIDKTPQQLYPELPKTNVRIWDKLPVRHWDEWLTGKYSHLFIVPAKGGNPIDMMPGEAYDSPVKPFGGAEQIAWSPDGKEIAYTSKKVNNYSFTTNNDIFLIPVTGGKAVNITESLKGADQDPIYSPDGKWIAFHSQEREGFESDRNRLMLYNRQNHELKELSKTLDQWVGQFIWAPDSKSLYFSAENGATVQIYQMQVADGSWKIVTKGNFNYENGLDITPDGKTLVFGRMSMVEPVDICTMPAAGGDVKKITTLNDALLSTLKPITFTEKWIKSTDGKRVQCWVVYPPDFDPKKKYPMITYCQGGPQSTISQYFSYRWNFYIMASQGYVIIAANRRGVPGFGQAWNDAISKDWGGKPMQDVLAATDEMLKEPYIDKNRVAAVGASAGGYQVYWLEGNGKGRFSAFVAHSGVFNQESEYGATEEIWFPDWENGGPYWDPKYKPYYEKNSPHKFTQNWNTPIMISAGEMDFRVPYTQALEAFTVAQAKGIPSKLVLFPEENHWVLKVQNSILWQHEFFNFLDKYCKNK